MFFTTLLKSELVALAGMTYVSYFLAEDGPAHDKLLQWVNTKIPDQKVKNFNSDWKSGVAICALNNSVFPGTCPDYQSLDTRDKLNNCQKGSSLDMKLKSWSMANNETRNFMRKTADWNGN